MEKRWMPANKEILFYEIQSGVKQFKCDRN